MEPEKATTGRGSEPEPETMQLLALCTSLLRLQKFTRCREFALRVVRSDPKISDSVDRILAIADVHVAAERRLSNNLLDWYAILQLRRVDAGNHQLIRSQFKRLAHLLNPNRNVYAFSNEAFVLVRDAWRVLSDPEKRAQYEQAIGNRVNQEQSSGSKQEGSRGIPTHGHNVNASEPKATFWTLCPYCWVLYEYEKIYEDCSLRCQKCRKVFHAMPVKPPATDMLVTGKEQYYCYCAHVPLRYPPSQHSTDIQKQWSKDGKAKNGKAFVDIPDEDGVDYSSRHCGIGGQGRVFHAEQAGSEGLHGDLGNGKRRMRVKTVARNTKKITGNRMRYQGHMSPDRDAEWSDLDAEDGNLEFTEREADAFANVRCAK
ncbi:uncharacterized protein G2W53_036098 [Senna tora]|uniref:J domain-containing protein n=1 Tax=Senna tora TaxID=362788 RepID=A0A834SVA2_9FABA|nr:uncharacterized protein G2W53_036098 [Senna tora]